MQNLCEHYDKRKKCRQFRLLLPLSFIGQVFYPVGEGGKEKMGEFGDFSKFHFIREHENLMQNPTE